MATRQGGNVTTCRREWNRLELLIALQHAIQLPADRRPPRLAGRDRDTRRRYYGYDVTVTETDSKHNLLSPLLYHNIHPYCLLLTPD